MGYNDTYRKESKFKRQQNTKILREQVFESMKNMSPTDPRYSEMAELLVLLDKNKVSPDTKLLVAAGLAQVLLILTFEHAHPVVSKAFNFVLKPR